MSTLTNRSGLHSDNETNSEMTKRSESPFSSELGSSFQIHKDQTNKEISFDYDSNNLFSPSKKDRLLDNIQKKDKIVKDLFNNNISEKDDSLNEGMSLTNFLLQNKFFLLLSKIEEGELSEHQLIGFSDEKIMEMVEEENKNKFHLLRDFIMKLDDNNDAEDLLKSIDKTMENEDISIKYK